MTKEFFESVLRIPSASGKEDMMRDFIVEWSKSHGCKASVDGKGNVTVVKGSPKEGGFYPCLANHMDAGSCTHNRDQDDLIEKKMVKEIIWKGDKAECVNPLTKKQVGLGMDDQGGCAIAMSVLDRLPYGKAVFVVEEEIGMRGSEALDKSFFDDCAFIISNDSPDRNRATHYSSGVELYSKDFFDKFLEPICKKHGVTSFHSEPYTDIIKYRKYALKDGKHLECLNFGNGGYNAHMANEYAEFGDVNKAEELLYALCTEIPLDKQYTSDIGEEPRMAWSGYSGGSYSSSSYNGDWWKQWMSGRRSGTQAMFFNHGDGQEETGHFDWKFKTAEAAEMAKSRLPKLLGGVTVTVAGNTSVRVSGEKSKLRTAFRFAYNYDNAGQKGVPYKHDLEFYQSVKAASDMFKQKFVVDRKTKQDPRNNPDSECSISLYFSDSDQLDQFIKYMNDMKNAAEVDDDGYSSCTVTGKLKDLKYAYVAYVNCDIGGKPKYSVFDQLRKQDQKAFWEDIEFQADLEPDDKKDDAIDVDFEMVDDEPDDDLPPADTEDDGGIWNWDDDIGAPAQPAEKDHETSTHSPDEQCFIELEFRNPTEFEKFEKSIQRKNVQVKLDRMNGRQCRVSGKLKDVQMGIVTFLNRYAIGSIYTSFDGIPETQKESFWKEVKFQK